LLAVRIAPEAIRHIRQGVMTTTEEIIVSGQDFIERRILVYPEQEDIFNIRDSAFGSGYKRGWQRGFLMGVVLVGVVVICVWLAVG
jgi:hypothetical protein